MLMTPISNKAGVLQGPLPRQARGVTMIEVLVSIVILSIGLLGYAGLLLKSNKDNLMAFQRSQATIMAYDIIDSMRVNKSAATAGSYNTSFASTASSGSQIHQVDLLRWKGANGLLSGLPGGAGQIAVDGNGNATVEIRWNDQGQTAGTTPQTLTFRTQTQL
jgi:type IV pilus assembly protein PilV